MAARSVLACREYVYNKKLLFATHACIRSLSAQPAAGTPPAETAGFGDRDTIIIPKRIRRGPTDILKALASTVKQDYTAPHYKYHDDPFFIPASNVAKRTYALAKESGRKAAKYFLDKYPNSFFHNPAEPNIEAFNAKPKYTAESDVVETDLTKCVDAADVDSAIVVYHNLKAKGVQVSQESLQSLLELLCFYNCKQPLDEDLTEERWHRQMAPRETRKSWKDGGLAEQVFDSLENKDSRAYAAVIQGMAKHFQVDKAYELFKEMQSKGLTPSIEVYNGLLSLVPFLREGYDNRWDLANELMRGIENDGLKPNISTMNNVLEIISRFGASPSARKYALQTFSEMKHIGVEPSLASYYYLLVIFCKTRGAPSTILHNIMKELENKTFEIWDPQDVFFFVSAMDVCHSHLLDKELAYKVHTLLNFGENYNLIGDSFKESIYYQHFFKLLCSTENIDTFFDIYNKYVPNIYTPEPSVICEIIEAVDLSGAVEYLPQLWSDIILFGHYERENVVKAVLEVMAKRKQEPKLQAQFAVIAADINERCDGDPETRRTRPIQWTGQMFGKMISVFLNAERLQDAWQIMQKLDKEQHRILGYPEQECLKKFCQACLDNSDETKALFCARYAADIGLTDVGEHLRQGENIKKLSENAKQKLTELLNSSALNSSETYSKED
uniref:Small ribosomal subunit protein mS39 n=1 Tax=Ixodes ricinus TaxID=34613 RepID=A0A131Y211_IXORI